MTDRLDRVLERGRRLGFLGPGSLQVQREHAVGFAQAAGQAPARFLDLGSGGGVPGLVLAAGWPQSRGVLLDARARQCAFLREAVAELDLEERITVLRGRAEELGRQAGLRVSFDLVAARSFGPPAVTAECGAPFLRPGGRLVVSGPPRSEERDDAGREAARREDARREGEAIDRWPSDGLAQLGLERGRTWRHPFHYQVLVQQRPCPERYPRRVGVPAKRPLFF